ncbi:MAG: DNA-packaging protein [Exiguobacterium sp.]|nr:DNA-packaging protein [Exiguobacterium sp.]
MAFIDDVKMALRVSSTALDPEITRLISAAQSDLGIAGVLFDDLDEPVAQAVITYCKMNFGIPDDYDRLKASYDEQKSQLVTDTAHTDWLEY